MKSINLSLKLVLLAAGCTVLSLWVGGCSKNAEKVEVAPVLTQDLPSEEIPTSLFSEENIASTSIVKADDEVDLGGKCAPGSTVKILEGAQEIGSIPCNNEGGWAYSYNTGATEKTVQLNFTQVETSTGQATGNDSVNIQVDNTAPDLQVTDIQISAQGATGITDKPITSFRKNEKLYYALMSDCPDETKVNSFIELKDKSTDPEFNLINRKDKKISVSNAVPGTKMLVLVDEVGNFKCKSINIKLAAVTSEPNVKTDVQNDFQIEIGKTFDPNENQITDMKGLKLKVSNITNLSNAISYKYQQIKDGSIPTQCPSFQNNAQTGKVASKDQEIQIVPTELIEPQSGKDYVIAFQLEYTGKKSLCKVVSIDYMKPSNLSSIKGENFKVGEVPFSQNVFPTISMDVKGTNNLPQAGGLVISLDIVNNSNKPQAVRNCNKQYIKWTSIDGLKATRPDFGGQCKTDGLSKYRYSIEATTATNLQEANQSNSSKKFTFDWVARVCPNQLGSNYGQVEIGGMLAVNDFNPPFCVARYETRVLKDNPAITSSGSVKTNVTYDEAFKACQTISSDANVPKLKLISNAQWLHIAKLILKNQKNWVLAPGQKPGETGTSIRKGVSTSLAAFSSIKAPDPNSSTKGQENRAFFLPEDGVIYDFGGNAGEWVTAEVGSLDKAKNYSQTSSEGSSSSLFKNDISNVIKQAKYKSECLSATENACGLGSYNFSNIKNVNKTELDTYSEVLGGSAKSDQSKSGILSIETKEKNAKDLFVGFRCVYTGK